MSSAHDDHTPGGSIRSAKEEPSSPSAGVHQASDDKAVPALVRTLSNGLQEAQPPAYTGKRSWFRSTFTQATILGIASFCAPGLWGAMNSLGAGGQSSASTVNAANAITFVLMVFTSYLTPALINTVGVPFSLAIGTAGYGVYAGGLYLSSVTAGATTWLVIFGAVCCGISAGIFWSTEGAVILSYPERENVGKYVSYWLMFRVLGQLIGGAINLGLNASNNEKGSISTNTYIVFIVLQCIGPLVALTLSKPEKVQRSDRTPVRLNLTGSVKSECIAVWKLLCRREVALLLPMIVQTVFSESLTGTYNVTYFSVRSRALGGFLAAIVATLGNYILGFFLDWQKLSLNTRTKSAYLVVYTLAGAWWIFGIIIMNRLHVNPPAEPFDWSNQADFATPFAVYILIQLSFNLMYELTYFIVQANNDDSGEVVRLASIVRGVESAGQAVSYGINSTSARLDAVAGVNAALWAICVVPAWIVIRKIGILEDGTKIYKPLPHKGQAVVIAKDVKGRAEDVEEH